MFRHLNKKRKGQSTVEYVVLIIVIIGALLSIQIYIKRGISGRLKSASDDIGDQFSVGNTNVERSTHSHGRTIETYKRGVQNSILDDIETTNTEMTSNVINTQQEFFGSDADLKG